MTGASSHTTALITRRVIRATPEELFAAWTDPEQLVQWWGPDGVECIGAELDVRVGGAYRIGNRLPDGAVVWIVGTYDIVDAPHRLRFSWKLESQPAAPEQVTVTFTPRDGATEVVVTHERIASAASRENHERGWVGCLAGLDQYSQKR